MGIRKPSVKTEKGRGGWVAVRLPNNPKVRSMCGHIPLYVGICVQPYCGQHR
jgi:hypothetical protein